MRIFHTVSGLRDALKVHRREGLRIGFVPTMGNLHQGHLALIEAGARQLRHCGLFDFCECVAVWSQ